jgi:hypothetical protein
MGIFRMFQEYQEFSGVFKTFKKIIGVFKSLRNVSIPKRVFGIQEFPEFFSYFRNFWETSIVFIYLKESSGITDISRFFKNF